ncbi:tRNA1(Val) (adenine(37)-N6)-methyltransferase [Mannheimia haemolytica]|nr:tRNA1(Val) (adenine(37)-N6)-methyltransferase [Mannheimia haemolytica]
MIVVTLLRWNLNQMPYQQAVENAQNSAWANRISVLQGDVMQQAFEQKFDLIVSNPPYFADSLAARTTERDLARSISHYSHLNWLGKSKTMVSRERENYTDFTYSSCRKIS